MVDDCALGQARVAGGDGVDDRLMAHRELPDVGLGVRDRVERLHETALVGDLRVEADEPGVAGRLAQHRVEAVVDLGHLGRIPATRRAIHLLDQGLESRDVRGELRVDRDASSREPFESPTAVVDLTDRCA